MNATDMTYCVQCTDKTSGRVGDFLFNDSAPFIAVSPVFSDLVELFTYMRENGLATQGYGFKVYSTVVRK